MREPPFRPRKPPGLPSREDILRELRDSGIIGKSKEGSSQPTSETLEARKDRLFAASDELISSLDDHIRRLRQDASGGDAGAVFLTSFLTNTFFDMQTRDSQAITSQLRQLTRELDNLAMDAASESRFNIVEEIAVRNRELDNIIERGVSKGLDE
jgi:hypothetical protein